MQTNKILSKRELNVLTLVAAGYTSEQIGESLTITTATVQTHRRNRLRNTGFNNTHQLVGWGYKLWLLK